MDSSFWFGTIYLGLPIVHVEGSQAIFSKYIIFPSLKMGFVSANSVDPNEMMHYVAFHLGDCLPKY